MIDGILLPTFAGPPASRGGGRPFLVLLGLLLAASPLWAGGTPSPAVPDHAPPIAITSVRWSAAGYMLDVRYRILDVDGAWAAFNRRQRPVLHHAASGATLIVPAPAYVGPLVQTSERPKPDRIYFMFFANPGRLVQPGDTVTLSLAGRTYGPFTVH